MNFLTTKVRFPKNSLYWTQYRTKLSQRYKYDLKPNAYLNGISIFLKKVGNKTKKNKDYTPQPIKRFAKKQLYSDYIARMLQKHSASVLVSGLHENLNNRSNINFRVAMRNAGFEVNYVKRSELIAATKFYMTKECSVSTDFVAEQSYGHMFLMNYQHDVNDLFLPGNKNISKLRKILSFTSEDWESKNNPPKKRKAKDLLPWDKFIVKGVFINDSDKPNPFVWFKSEEFINICETLTELSASVAEDQISDINAHALLHSSMVNTIQNAMGQLTSPLEQGLSELPTTIEKTSSVFASTLDAMLQKKQEEEK